MGVKKLLSILSVVILSFLKLSAQEIPLTAVIDNRSIEANSIAKILLSKLDSSLTQAGFHSEEEAGLYLVGELLNISEDNIDTGMRKVSIRKYNLSLRLEQPILHLKFGTIEIPLEGYGLNPSKAAIDAVRKFSPTSSDVQNFLISSVQKAEEYYASHVNEIIDKANILNQSGQFEEAIALLWSCPNIESIHEPVFAALNKIYLEKQNKDCYSMIMKAQTAFSQKKYSEAEEYLNAIDPQSQCAEEAFKLAQKMELEIRNAEAEAHKRAERAEELAFKREDNKRARAHELSKRRISAIENIATSFFQSQHFW